MITSSTPSSPASSFRTFARELITSAILPALLFSLFFLAAGWSLKPESMDVLKAFLSSPDMSAVALMALGTYVLGVLIVGTLSTAHDGEMLGTQWSSLWIPIRVSVLAGLFFPVVETGNGSISLLADAGLWLLQLTA